MKTISKSALLALPGPLALPYFDQEFLREADSPDVLVWVGEDGVACCLREASEPESSYEDDGIPGEWVRVTN